MGAHFGDGFIFISFCVSRQTDMKLLFRFKVVAFVVITGLDWITIIVARHIVFAFSLYTLIVKLWAFIANDR